MQKALLPIKATAPFSQVLHILLYSLPIHLSIALLHNHRICPVGPAPFLRSVQHEHIGPQIRVRRYYPAASHKIQYLDLHMTWSPNPDPASSHIGSELLSSIYAMLTGHGMPDLYFLHITSLLLPFLSPYPATSRISRLSPRRYPS